MPRSIRAELAVGALLALAIVLLFGACAPVEAQDPTGKYAGAPNSAWFAAQHSANGGYCCDGADAHYYDGDYELHADGSVTLKMASGDVEISTQRVVDPTRADNLGPNPTGHAVWWYGYDNATTAGTYCFAFGPLT